MPTTCHKRRHVFAAAVVAFVVASCGSSGGGSAAPAETSTTTAVATLEHREALELVPSDSAGANCPEKVNSSTWFWDSRRTACWRLGPSLLDDSKVTTANATEVDGKWGVDVTYAPGAFEAVATQLAGRQLAIVFRGTVVTVPTIAPGFKGDVVRISGTFDEQSARELAAALTS